MTSSRRKKKHRAGKFRSGPFDVADGSGGGDCGEGASSSAQAPSPPRVAACSGASSASRAAIHWFSDSRRIQHSVRLPPRRTFRNMRVDLTLTGKVPDPPAGRVCYHLRLVRGHPLGVPPHGSRKVAMLATDQALPILDYKPLEDIMKESEFAARKNAKQVAVKIPEDLAEVQSGRIG